MGLGDWLRDLIDPNTKSDVKKRLAQGQSAQYIKGEVKNSVKRTPEQIRKAANDYNRGINAGLSARQAAANVTSERIRQTGYKPVVVVQSPFARAKDVLDANSELDRQNRIYSNQPEIYKDQQSQTVRNPIEQTIKQLTGSAGDILATAPSNITAMLGSALQDPAQATTKFLDTSASYMLDPFGSTASLVGKVTNKDLRTPYQRARDTSMESAKAADTNLAIEPLDDAGKWLEDSSNKVTENINRNIAESSFSPDTRDGENRAIGAIAPAMGSLLAAIGVSAATRNPYAVTGIFGASEGQQQLKDAKAAGMDNIDALTNATGAAIASGVFENWGAGKLLKAGGGSVLKRGVKGVITEGSEEFVQSLASSGFRNNYEEQKPSDVLLNAFKSAAIGGITGGIAGSTGAVYNKASNSNVGKSAASLPAAVKQVINAGKPTGEALQNLKLKETQIGAQIQDLLGKRSIAETRRPDLIPVLDNRINAKYAELDSVKKSMNSRGQGGFVANPFYKDPLDALKTEAKRLNPNLAVDDLSETRLQIAIDSMKQQAAKEYKDAGTKMFGSRKDLAKLGVVDTDKLAGLENEGARVANKHVTKSRVLGDNAKYTVDRNGNPSLENLKKIYHSGIPSKPADSPQARAWYVKNMPEFAEKIKNATSLEEIDRAAKELITNERGYLSMEAKEYLGARSFNILRGRSEAVSRAKWNPATDFSFDEVKKTAATKPKSTVTLHGGEQVEYTRSAGKTLKDKSPKAVANEFGFKGVEYGNYVGDKSANTHITKFADSMLDLEDEMGMNLTELNKQMKLGAAFGSRGQGGKAIAHYEPSNKVINITKKNTVDGSLAHEYIHALDDFLGDGKKMNEYASSGRASNPRVNEAMREVMKVIKEGDGGVTVARKPNVRYGNAARLDELLKEAKTAQGALDLYTQKYKGASVKNKKKIADYFMSKTGEDEVVLKTGRSNMFEAADSKGEYWKRDTELFARAYADLVRDRLAKKGVKNNYITYETPRDSLWTPDDLNKFGEKMDNLLKVVKEEYGIGDVPTRKTLEATTPQPKPAPVEKTATLQDALEGKNTKVAKVGQLEKGGLADAIAKKKQQLEARRGTVQPKVKNETFVPKDLEAEKAKMRAKGMSDSHIEKTLAKQKREAELAGKKALAQNAPVEQKNYTGTKFKIDGEVYTFGEKVGNKYKVETSSGTVLIHQNDVDYVMTNRPKPVKKTKPAAKPAEAPTATLQDALDGKSTKPPKKVEKQPEAPKKSSARQRAEDIVNASEELKNEIGNAVLDDHINSKEYQAAQRALEIYQTMTSEQEANRLDKTARKTVGNDVNFYKSFVEKAARTKKEHLQSVVKQLNDLSVSDGRITNKSTGEVFDYNSNNMQETADALRKAINSVDENVAIELNNIRGQNEAVKIEQEKLIKKTNDKSKAPKKKTTIADALNGQPTKPATTQQSNKTESEAVTKVKAYKEKSHNIIKGIESRGLDTRKMQKYAYDVDRKTKTLDKVPKKYQEAVAEWNQFKNELLKEYGHSDLDMKELYLPEYSTDTAQVVTLDDLMDKKFGNKYKREQKQDFEKIPDIYKVTDDFIEGLVSNSFEGRVASKMEQGKTKEQATEIVKAEDAVVITAETVAGVAEESVIRGYMPSDEKQNRRQRRKAAKQQAKEAEIEFGKHSLQNNLRKLGIAEGSDPELTIDDSVGKVLQLGGTSTEIYERVKTPGNTMYKESGFGRYASADAQADAMELATKKMNTAEVESYFKEQYSDTDLEPSVTQAEAKRVAKQLEGVNDADLRREIMESSIKRVAREEMTRFAKTYTITNKNLKTTFERDLQRIVLQEKVARNVANKFVDGATTLGYYGALGYNVFSAGQNLFETKKSIARYGLIETAKGAKQAAEDPGIVARYGFVGKGGKYIEGEGVKQSQTRSWWKPMGAFNATEYYKDAVLLHTAENYFKPGGKSGENLTGTDLTKRVHKEVAELASKGGIGHTLGYSKNAGGRLFGQFTPYTVRTLKFTGKRIGEATGVSKNVTHKQRVEASKYLARLAVTNTALYMALSALLGYTWEYAFDIFDPTQNKATTDDNAGIDEKIISYIPGGPGVGFSKDIYINIKRNLRDMEDKDQVALLDKIWKAGTTFGNSSLDKRAATLVVGGNQFYNKTGGFVRDQLRGYNTDYKGDARFEATDTGDTYNMIKGMLFGRWATDNAMEYWGKDQPVISGLPKFVKDALADNGVDVSSRHYAVTDRTQAQLGERSWMAGLPKGVQDWLKDNPIKNVTINQGNGLDVGEKIAADRAEQRRRAEFKKNDKIGSNTLDAIYETTEDANGNKVSDVISMEQWKIMEGDSNLRAWNEKRLRAEANNKRYGDAVDPIYKLTDPNQVRQILQLRAMPTGDDKELKATLRADKNGWYNKFEKDYQAYGKSFEGKTQTLKDAEAKRENEGFVDSARKKEYRDLSQNNPAYNDSIKSPTMLQYEKIRQNYFDNPNDATEKAKKDFFKSNKDILSPEMEALDKMKFVWTNKMRELEKAPPISEEQWNNPSYGFNSDLDSLYWETYFARKDANGSSNSNGSSSSKSSASLKSRLTYNLFHNQDGRKDMNKTLRKILEEAIGI